MDIEHIAKLARLRLTDAEKETFTKQMETIVEYIEKLNELDTEGVEPTSHVLPLGNAFRRDEVDPSPAVAEILAAAPQRQGRYYKVPRIIE